MMEKFMTFIFLIFSLAYLYFSRELSFGIIAAPKAGFMPTVAAVLAVVMAIIIAGRQELQTGTGENEELNWKKMGFAVVGIIVYVFLLKFSNYIIATFLIVFYLFKVTDTPGWKNPCLLAGGFTLSFYYLLVNLLGNNLP